LLPFVAVFLLLAVNDRALMGRDGLNRISANVFLGLVVAVTLVLGATNVAKAGAAALGFPVPGETLLLGGSAALALLLAWPLGRRAARKRRGG
jgi:hypothetical protein